MKNGKALVAGFISISIVIVLFCGFDGLWNFITTIWDATLLLLPMFKQNIKDFICSPKVILNIGLIVCGACGIYVGVNQQKKALAIISSILSVLNILLIIVGVV